MIGRNKNLLEETVRYIVSNNLNINDIDFIGSINVVNGYGYSCSFEQFKILADKEYDSGYGSQEVASDLIIHFVDGTIMYRAEYDGSERWSHRLPFKKPEKTKQICSLFSKEGYESLDSINEYI